MPPISIKDAAAFWQHLASKNSYLHIRLKSHLLAPGDVVAVQPASMSDEHYNEYKKILFDWLTERGFLEELQLNRTGEK